MRAHNWTNVVGEWSTTSTQTAPVHPSNFCLADRQMKLSVDGMGHVLIGYVVPVVAFLGISGNLLNLTVLLAKKMRTRSNSLLASLAMVDIVFLFCFLPEAMANHQTFYMSNAFRRFYFHSQIFRLHIQNWFSAAAIWLILIICGERLLGIRNPLSSRTHSSLMAPKFIVSLTVIFTGLLTSHYHFTFVCRSKVFCHGAQFHQFCHPVDSQGWFGGQANPSPIALRLFARYSLEIQAVAIVFLPVLLVVFSNLLLLLTLRKRTRFLKMGAGSEAMTTIQIKKEQRVTLTVCAIVTCFTFTQAPSAMVPVIASLTGASPTDFSTQTIIVSTMVVVGKALNFILFCLSSSNFRQRLLFRTKELANNSAMCVIFVSVRLNDKKAYRTHIGCYRLMRFRKAQLQASTRLLSMEFKTGGGSRPVSRPSSRLSLWPIEALDEPVSKSPQPNSRLLGYGRRGTLLPTVRSAPRLNNIAD